MKLDKFNRTYKEKDAPKSVVYSYSILSGFRDALMQFIALFLLLYVQFASPLINESLSNYEIMYLIITLGIALIKVIAGLATVFISYFINKAHTRFGKFRPFIIVGSVLTTIFYFLMFSNLGSGYLYVALFLIFVLIHEVTYTINDNAWWSYVPTLSEDDAIRGKILSIMNTSIAIGTYVVAAISPLVTAGDAKKNLTIVAIVLGVLYLLSQLIFALFFMKEKEGINKNNFIDRNGVSIDKGIRGVFAILFKDKQVLIAMISFFLMFCAQMTLMGNSANYFYYTYGYGEFGSIPLNNAMLSGGAMSFLFTICYGVGYTISMITFPLLQKKFTRKKLLIASLIVLTLGYLYLFFFGLSIGFEISLFIVSLITFYFQGVYYLIFTLNCTNSIEYHKAKFHEQNESGISSFKSLGVKSANAVQTILLYLFLFISNLLPLNSEIASFEAQYNLGQIDLAYKENSIRDAILNFANIDTSLIIYRVGITILPLICLLVGGLLTLFKFKCLDEKYYQEILKEINE